MTLSLYLVGPIAPNLQNVKKMTNLYIKLSNPSFNTYFEEWL